MPVGNIPGLVLTAGSWITRKILGPAILGGIRPSKQYYAGRSPITGKLVPVSKRTYAQIQSGAITREQAQQIPRKNQPGYRPDLTERGVRPEKINPPPKAPPKTPPPPPPPPGGSGPNRRPRFGGPGSIRSQIISYVVANGVVWGITKLGEWVRMRNATADEQAAGTVLGTPGGGPRRGGPRGAAPAKLEPIRVTARRVPIPRPRPATVSQAKLEPIIVTATRAPIPAPLPASAQWISLGKKLAPSLLPQLSTLLKTGPKSSKARKQLSQALTALNTLGVASPSTNVSSYFSGYGGGTPTKTKACSCAKPKKRKPKQPREVCYGGTYTETATGLVKRKRRRVPCR